MTSDEIKSLYGMRDILARYGMQEPNRSGFIRCPFHKGDREPSMKIYRDGFNCYACGANGDIFTFVQRMDGLSFRGAFLELGGEYGNDFSARMKIYKAQKAREMAKKERERQQNRRALNNTLISIYMKYMERSEPLSDTWCKCCNALHYQLYINEILNSPEERHGVIEQTEQGDSPFGQRI